MKTLSVIWLTLFSIENFLLSSLHKLYNSIIYLIKCRFFGISKSHLSEETTFEIYLLIFHLALYILEAGYMYKKGRLLFPDVRAGSTISFSLYPGVLSITNTSYT